MQSSDSIHTLVHRTCGHAHSAAIAPGQQTIEREIQSDSCTTCDATVPPADSTYFYGSTCSLMCVQRHLLESEKQSKLNNQ